MLSLRAVLEVRGSQADYNCIHALERPAHPREPASERGVHLRNRTESEEVLVNLGSSQPAGEQLTPKDMIEVRDSRSVMLENIGYAIPFSALTNMFKKVVRELLEWKCNLDE